MDINKPKLWSPVNLFQLDLKYDYCALVESCPPRKVATILDMDTSLLSKKEREERCATKEQINKLTEILNASKNELMIPYLSEIIDEDCANEVLKVVEKIIEYKRMI